MKMLPIKHKRTKTMQKYNSKSKGKPDDFSVYHESMGNAAVAVIIVAAVFIVAMAVFLGVIYGLMLLPIPIIAFLLLKRADGRAIVTVQGDTVKYRRWNNKIKTCTFYDITDVTVEIDKRFEQDSVYKITVMRVSKDLFTLFGGMVNIEMLLNKLKQYPHIRISYTERYFDGRL